MLTFALILTFISIFFYRLGAWPILFFTVIDLFLIWGAFKINYKNGRTYEIIKLTYFKLEITRVYPNGTKSRVYFEPSWVKIWLDNSPLHNSSIRIRSHGNQIILGSFLPPKEKYEVMESLKNALKNRLDFIKQEKLSSI